MSREAYQRSDETFKVLSGHEAEFAREADKDVSYFNKVKNGVEKDPFAHFRAMFRVACRTTADVQIWLRELDSIFERSRPQANAQDISARLLDKIQSDSETMSVLVEALSDRHLDASECHEILARLERNKQIAESIEMGIKRRLGDLGEKRLRSA
ncbi:MAG TPA: hypothetical protein PLX39_15435 [Pyrinomonadaceae bacterium]|nr:hypothetical protein [Pyrinomonadaceae bacterium]